MKVTQDEASYLFFKSCCLIPLLNFNNNYSPEIATLAQFFPSLYKIKTLNKILLIFLLFAGGAVKAQHIDSIYVNLYTDSLKKGTFNYINVDGLMSNGRYCPLDSSHILFTASAGKFTGNTLWIDKDFSPEKVNIKVILKKNPTLHKEFVVYIKKKPDDENLKTTQELLNEMQSSKGKKKKG